MKSRFPIALLILALLPSATYADLIGYYTGTHNVDNWFNAVARCFPINPADVTTDYQIDSISILIYDSDDDDNYLMAATYTDQGGPFGPAARQAVSDSFVVPQNPSADTWSAPNSTLKDTIPSGVQYWIAFAGWAGDGSISNDHENVVASAGGYRDSCYQNFPWDTLDHVTGFPATATGVGASTGIMNVKVWVTDVGGAPPEGTPGRRRRLLLSMSEPEDKPIKGLLYYGDRSLLTAEEKAILL